jgi:predicted transposase YbfD/YdcC
MNLTIFERVQQSPSAPLQIDPRSLYCALEQVPDGRKRRGRRYPLALIFTFLPLGKLAGETTIHGVVEWVALREEELKRQLNWPRRLPSNATYTRALAVCDAEELVRMVAQVLLKARASEEATRTLRQVAVDGKTPRGTLLHPQQHQPPVHVLSWYEPQTGLVLAHRAVPHQRNEISTLADWLSPALVKDRVITADALHTQRTFCADVIRFAGHYVLIARGNQPTLWQELRLFFTDPQSELAGMKSLLGASDWVRDQQKRLWECLMLSWKQMPCANTYKYALARLDSQQVNEQLRAWLVRTEAENRCGAEPSRLAAQSDQRAVHLAIDGKVLKGTGKQAYGGERPQKYILHVYEVQTGIVLHHCPIDEKQNEVSALKPLLTEVLCKGRIFTADAAQSYHEFGRLVQRAGGDVILIVKDNTPATRADLELFFEDPQADRRTWHCYERVEKGHGRLERRQLLTSPDLNEYLRRDWGEVGQVFRLQRERKPPEQSSVEVVYGWTNLTRQCCSAQRLFDLIRAHWAVENRLHGRRDVTLGEDRCGVRVPAVAQMLAVLNSLVLSLMDLHQISNVARQIRRFSSHPEEALTWVL